MDGFNNELGNNQTNEDVVTSTNYQDYTSDAQYQASPTGNPYGDAASQGDSGTSGLAVAALVFGILAILLGCCTGCLGIICGIVGIIFAVIDKKNGPSGVAKGGLVCSIIGLILGILITVLYVVYFYMVGTVTMDMMENPDAYMEMMEGELSESEMEELMEALEEMEDMY